MKEQSSYGGGARHFHWLTVAILLVIIRMGLVMGGLPRGALQNMLFVTHESLRLTLLALTLARFAWRLDISFSTTLTAWLPARSF